MNPLLQEFLTATLRHWLTMAGTALLAKGWIQGDGPLIEKYAAGFAVLFVSFMWTYGNKYWHYVLVKLALQADPSTPEQEVRVLASKEAKTVPRGLLLGLLVACTVFQGCALHRKIPVLAAETTLGTAQTIGQLQVAGEQLQRANVLTVQQAITLQSKLLTLNNKVAQVVPMLRAINVILQSGTTPSASEIERVVAIIVAISQELAVLLTGVPVNEQTAQLQSLVMESQRVILTTISEIARIQAALEK